MASFLDRLDTEGLLGRVVLDDTLRALLDGLDIKTMHFVDPAGADAATEWQPAYDTISADQAIHNPSTYAVFARHVHTGQELRFGLQPWR